MQIQINMQRPYFKVATTVHRHAPSSCSIKSCRNIYKLRVQWQQAFSLQIRVCYFLFGHSILRGSPTCRNMLMKILFAAFMLFHIHSFFYFYSFNVQMNATKHQAASPTVHSSVVIRGAANVACHRVQ